tara:strand:- start:1462 stop:2013 length:552 start_codon:yes stop_codon:yes gene_type:complete
MIKNFQSIEYFETSRLIARRHTEADFDLVLSTYQNELTMQTLGGIVTHDVAAKRIQWNLDCWKNDGFGGWLWFVKESGQFVGRAGIRRVEIEGESVIEVGYVLLPEFWDKGFATEMAVASIEIAFTHLSMKELVAFTSTTNKLSQRVMDKAGLKFQHTFTHFGEEHVLYRITLNDFLANRKKM